MNSLDEEEQLFIMAHEISHIALNHIERGKNKDPEVWNTATDAITNENLVNDGLKMVADGVYIEGATKYDAEELYEKLIKDNKNLPKCNNHNIWNRKFDENNTSKNKENSRENIDKELEGEIKKISELGEKKAYQENKKEKKKRIKEMCKSLAKDSISVDSKKESIINIDNIGTTKAMINWLRLLKTNVKNLVDWSYKNAEIEDGIVTPKLEKLPDNETEILLDTSGSVSKKLLKNFLRECKNIIKTSKLKVGCFDDKFYGFYEIRTEKDIDNMKYFGGGGTNFDVAINSFSKTAVNKIIFTDGFADMPKANISAIWVVYGSQKINPKSGKVIYINEEELSKLQYENDNIIENKTK